MPAKHAGPARHQVGVGKFTVAVNELELGAGQIVPCRKERHFRLDRARGGGHGGNFSERHRVAEFGGIARPEHLRHDGLELDVFIDCDKLHEIVVAAILGDCVEELRTGQRAAQVDDFLPAVS